METVRVTPRGLAVILTLPAEITPSSVQELRAAITQRFDADDFNQLIVDMTNLIGINSAGIGLLVSLKTKCQAAQKLFHLVNPAPQVFKTLEIVQLERFFSIAASVEDALQL